MANILESFHKLWGKIESFHSSGKMDNASVRFLESFKIIEKQINNLYQGQGGERLSVLGTIADPALCEIVDTFPTDDQSLDGTVMEVISHGHKLSSGQILKPSKVITYKF
ncbi:MAG: nucleotide exchange factor GrpE [Oligoflexia bacterium]|nr:nucleotide exchange factor GrpE [Oligoflexia bacterium]